VGKHTFDGVELCFYGHASICLSSGGKTLYVDPYTVPKGSPKADVILLTHDHFDHCANVAELSKPGATIVGTKGCAAKAGLTRSVSEGDRLELSWVTVEAVPSYNPDKPFHPRGKGVGYVITIAGKRFYVAGDTSLIPEMNGLKEILAAFLPIGGTYTMDMDEAAEAANIIKPNYVIPVHYNVIDGTPADPKKFASLVKHSEVLIL